MAPGTVMVISTIGIPPPATASAAKCASSADKTRIAGTIPTCSMTAAISLRFILPSLRQARAKLHRIPAGAILKLVAFRCRQQVAFSRNPDVQGRQQENTQKQRANKSADNYDRKRSLRIRTDAMR